MASTLQGAGCLGATVAATTEVKAAPTVGMQAAELGDGGGAAETNAPLTKRIVLGRAAQAEAGRGGCRAAGGGAGRWTGLATAHAARKGRRAGRRAGGGRAAGGRAAACGLSRAGSQPGPEPAGAAGVEAGRVEASASTELRFRTMLNHISISGQVSQNRARP